MSETRHQVRTAHTAAHAAATASYAHFAAYTHPVATATHPLLVTAATPPLPVIVAAAVATAYTHHNFTTAHAADVVTFAL